ncbi:MAG: D-glycero-beta-D-manno-heptose-7-phosphate kinase [Candidatus Omnitrophica bacterium]|nr:D-glycero-beta-D-manno-heptose-7-phosphate kinase [Candidatus Omnitrophota bacterium]MBU1785090.1 D-glycero-beta-D-manno-heptose-7-phosphate kinase [Candidatus Omnitrophota bacterium]
MKDYRYSTFANYVKKFSGKRILVVGDILLDQYVWGDVSRISPEAPVPVVWVKKEDYMPGGACNVANNLAALGADVSLAGVVGDDLYGELLKTELGERNIRIDGVISDSTRPTSQKTRVIAHNQQVVRIDREHINTVSDDVITRISDYIRRHVRDVDGVIIEDYGKGVITPELLKSIVPFARKQGKIVAVDPKENHFSYYRGVNVITPNHHEAALAVGFLLNDPDDICDAGEKLLKKLKTDNILITLGEEGMMLFTAGKKPQKIPTLAREVFDVSGAGDTVIGVYTLSRASGASPLISAHIANCAAGIVVGKVGAASVSVQELLSRLRLETKGKAA